jgi:hypothetical protein
MSCFDLALPLCYNPVGGCTIRRIADCMAKIRD